MPLNKFIPLISGWEGYPKTYENTHCPALNLNELRRENGVPRHSLCPASGYPDNVSMTESVVGACEASESPSLKPPSPRSLYCRPAIPSQS
jgi:hypothetical protein